MGRKSIDPNAMRPKAMINATFNKRKEGLKNKAKEIGVLCGCEVALIVFPPKGYHNNEVIDLSVNGNIVQIFQRYLAEVSILQQQNPGRKPLEYRSPPGPALQVQQSSEANLEGNEHAPPSNSSPQVQQPVQGMNNYASPIVHGQQNIFPNSNEHVGFNEQVAMQQQMHMLHGNHNMHPMQHGIQHGNPQHGIQLGNLQHHIPQNEHHILQDGNHILHHHHNQVPMHHGNHIPPQHGQGINYIPTRQRSNRLHQHNNMSALLHQQQLQAVATAPPQLNEGNAI
jgi:hypothetical protein